MFNIFKKPDDAMNCYLMASNLFSKKDLDEDTLEVYKEILENPETSDFF